MLKRIIDWLDERMEIRRLWDGFANQPIPGGASWFYVFGATLVFLFLLQMATGIFLAFYYVPSTDQAYASVKFIQEEAPFGSLVRGMHHWGAGFMMVIVALHMLRVFVFGSYKKPREIVWVIGVGLLVIVGMFAFTGYLLPWDQKAYWATVVGTNVAGTVPLVGGILLNIIRGGSEIDSFALSRFYAIHTYILPWSLVLLAGLHIFVLERVGAGGRWDAAEMVPYRSEPLFPNQLFRDAVAMLLVFICLLAFAIFLPAGLEPEADPADSTYNPRPEWYFYFVFQMLRIFEGRLEVVGTFIIPSLAITILLLIPFLDRRPVRAPSKRRFMMTSAVLVVAGVLALTVAGALAPIVAASSVTGPSIKAGRDVFAKAGCYSCHKIHGKGGGIAPDLTHIGKRRDAEWLKRFLENPQAVIPGTIMPKPEITEKELDDLVNYLVTLR